MFIVTLPNLNLKKDQAHQSAHVHMLLKRELDKWTVETCQKNRDRGTSFHLAGDRDIINHIEYIVSSNNFMSG